MGALKANLETEHLAVASIEYLGWNDVKVIFDDPDKQFYSFQVEGHTYDQKYGGFAFRFLDAEYRADIVNADLSYMWGGH